jgi:hypothetical protein
MKNEMGGACSKYGGKKRYIRILMGQPEGHLEDLCIDGRITLKK